MNILEIAKAEGLLFASLVAASGLEKLQRPTADAVLQVLRGFVLAAVSIKQSDLENFGVHAADQALFKDFLMEVYDASVSGWVERNRFYGPLN